MVEAAVLSPEPTRGTEGRPLRLLVFASKPVGLAPGQRFRLEQWAPRALAAHGIELEFAPFESVELVELLYRSGQKAAKAAYVLRDFVRRAADVVRARRYDAVIVFREAALVGPAIYERILDCLDIPIFYDFDDAIWNHNQTSKANGIFSKLHFYGKTSTICRISDGVFAGNEYLAAFARRHNSNVFVIPTSIELDRYAVQPEIAQPSPFVIVWSGSRSTLAHFEHAREALEILARRRPVAVKIICNEPPAVPIAGAENIFVPWTEAGEAEGVGAAHAGIMPLPDDAFTRGKCGLKALQFMAAGRPVVVAPVGMNRDLIQDGTNGLLASTTSEWVEALEKLASSSELRARLGAAGRKTVEDRYSAEVVTRRFANAVRSTLRA